mmetsp:Transcript_48470/g.80466  ORF Transcript_48470/g.80466 Transcript_48470/m.80466 type:complete len:357 (+) Transcript_48470:461-1531(+)
MSSMCSRMHAACSVVLFELAFRRDIVCDTSGLDVKRIYSFPPRQLCTVSTCSREWQASGLLSASKCLQVAFLSREAHHQLVSARQRGSAVAPCLHPANTWPSEYSNNLRRCLPRKRLPNRAYVGATAANVLMRFFETAWPIKTLEQLAALARGGRQAAHVSPPLLSEARVASHARIRIDVRMRALVSKVIKGLCEAAAATIPQAAHRVLIDAVCCHGMRPRATRCWRSSVATLVRAKKAARRFAFLVQPLVPSHIHKSEGPISLPAKLDQLATAIPQTPRPVVGVDLSLADAVRFFGVREDRLGGLVDRVTMGALETAPTTNDCASKFPAGPHRPLWLHCLRLQCCLRVLARLCSR